MRQVVRTRLIGEPPKLGEAVQYEPAPFGGYVTRVVPEVLTGLVTVQVDVTSIPAGAAPESDVP